MRLETEEDESAMKVDEEDNLEDTNKTGSPSSHSPP